MSRPWAQGGDTGRARRSRHGFTRVRSRVLPPPWGRAAHRERVPTREVSEDASVFRGALLPFLAWLSALCYDVPSASYQCKLAASLGRSLSRLRLSFPRASTMLLALVRPSPYSCAPTSPALELSRSQLLTHPLATQSLYLSLIFTSSLSLPFSSHAHARTCPF